MSIAERLRRYFVSNGAAIFSIRWIGGARKFIPWRCANARGFYWLGFQVGWRTPYFEGFSWNAVARRWEIPPSYPTDLDTIQ